jgi:signal transduction histidine kinase
MGTLRIRLSVWVLALFISVQLVTGFIFWLHQRTALSDMFDESLTNRATAIAPEVARALPHITQDQLDFIIMRAGLRVQFSAFRAGLVRPDHRIATISQVDWPSIALQAAREADAINQPIIRSMQVDWFRDDEDNRSESRMIAVPITSPTGERWTLLLARSDRFLLDQQRLFVRALLMSGCLGVFATCVSAWYIAGIAVKPLTTARRIASQLSPESLKTDIRDDSAPREVQQLAAALDDARARMRQAFEAQERFLSNISHELKTPIATLLVEAQTLDRTDMSKLGVQFVRSVEEEMRKLGKLVESFLTLTRVKDGKGLARAELVPINELVLDSVSYCSPMARQYAVKLKPELAASDDDVDAAISGDPELLRTMLDNLVRNAIRFSPESGSVIIISAVRGTEAVFEVRDQGSGLPPAMLNNAFDRFVQAPEEQKQGRGHGLGLTIAQAVAELHGGKITVRNVAEGGACFTLRLPLRGHDPITDTV